MNKKSEIELHVHPYFKAYDLEELIKAMDKNNLDIVALEYLNNQVFREVQMYSSKLKNKGYGVDSDNLTVKIEKENKQFYLLKAVELCTLDNFHLITIGSDDMMPYHPTERMIEFALKQDSLVIFDHPLVSNSNIRKKITKSKENKLLKICKEYSGNLALEWNGYCIPWLKKLLGGRNVNKEIIELSESLGVKGYNLPVVADTDLHARNKGALKAMGTARIKSEVDLTSGRSIIDSLKKEIFSLKHENIYKTVSLTHFTYYFALPFIFQRFFERPRG